MKNQKYTIYSMRFTGSYLVSCVFNSLNKNIFVIKGYMICKNLRIVLLYPLFETTYDKHDHLSRM